MEASTGKVTITICFMLAYFALLIWAAFFSKTGKMKDNSIEEFAVGSRNFGWIMVLFTMMGLLITASAFASWFAWATFEGLIVQYMLVYSTVGFLFSYMFAKKIWIWGRKFNLLTQPDYIQLRYRSRFLTTLFGVCSILIEAPWVIMEFAAMGIMVEALTYGVIGAKIGTLVVGAFVISYIIYSGMKAVAVTELIQGFLSSVVIAVGMIAIIYKLFGGFGPLYQQVMSVSPDSLTLTYNGTYTYEYWTSIIITGSLGIMGWASFFSRIYTSRSVMDIKKVSFWSAAIGCVFTALLLIAAMGGILFPEVVEAAGKEMAFFVMAEKAFGPVFLALCGIVVLAAGMSMVSVITNSHGIIITENFVKPFCPNVSSAQRVKIARWSILVYGIIALGIAIGDLPNLYTIALIAYEGITQVVPVIIFSLYWKRSNKWGALLGFTAGLIIAIVVAMLIIIYGQSFVWTGGVIGLAVNVIIHVICGFVCPKDEHVDELFDMIRDYEDEMDGDVKPVLA
ncbi:MAG: sodium:solute symporter family protein [Clostridia bacterium]|nr:sodium:solute symporter family protein [Clostridia bacterium]